MLPNMILAMKGSTNKNFTYTVHFESRSPIHAGTSTESGFFFKWLARLHSLLLNDSGMGIILLLDPDAFHTNLTLHFGIRIG